MAYNGGIGHSPTFQILLQSDSTEDHCMLAGEGRISSNYDFLIPSRPILQNTKSHFDVQRTHVVFIYRISLDVKKRVFNVFMFLTFFLFSSGKFFYSNKSSELLHKTT